MSLITFRLKEQYYRIQNMSIVNILTESMFKVGFYL